MRTVSKLFLSCLLIAVLMYGSQSLCAQSDDDIHNFEIKAFLEEDHVTYNHPFVFSVQMSWMGEETEYTFKPPTLQLDNLSLKEISSSSEQEVRGGRQLQKRLYNYHLVGIGRGKAGIKPIRIDYQRAGKSQVRIYDLPAFPITIEKPFISLEVLFVVAVGILGLFLIIILFRLITSKKKKQASEVTVIKTLEDVKLDELNGLESLMLEGEYNEILLRSLNILQNYLRDKYGLSFKEGKFTSALTENTQLSYKEKKELNSILEICHEAKYSGMQYDRSAVSETYKKVMMFIHGKKVV